MNPVRIYAIMTRHYFLATHQLERFFDVFFFPVFALVLWGFLSQYVQGIQGSTLASFLLGGIILWVIFERVGTDLGISFMFDIWERNLINVLSTPITFLEYLSGLITISLIKVFISFLAMWMVASFFYGFSVTSLGLGLALFGMNLILFATAFGIFNITMVLRFGHSVGPLTWILPFLIQPFSAVFYPVSVLPEVFQRIAYFLPLSHTFEGMRYTLNTGQFHWNEFTTAFLFNIIYLTLSIALFASVLNKVRRSGKLVKIV